MATKTKTTDTFANIAAVSVLESAANTQTVTKFDFPFSIMDKMALIINRIEYWSNILSSLNSSGDGVYMGLLAAGNVKSLADQNDPLIVDNCAIFRNDFGTAASGFARDVPFIKDFSSLPGGGLLVAPNPLYAAIEGSGEGSASGCWVKLYYTYINLSTEEYWQLVESRRIISS